MFELLQQCDLPPGVVNLVNGGRDVVERDLRSSGHPRGVVRRLDAGRASTSTSARPHAGKRVQALGGAKNFVVVMPDADFDAVDRRSSPSRSTAAPASAASRAACWCRSATRTSRRAIGWSRRREALKVGDGIEPGVTMGPVISARAPRTRASATSTRASPKARSCSSTAADAAVDDRPNGYFVGPTVFDEVSAEMAIGHEEIFGPVASICPVEDARRGDRADAARTRTPTPPRSSPRAARRRASSRSTRPRRWSASTSASRRRWPTSRSAARKDSFFGDLKAHGRDALRVLHRQEGHHLAVVLDALRPQGPSTRPSKDSVKTQVSWIFGPWSLRGVVRYDDARH